MYVIYVTSTVGKAALGSDMHTWDSCGPLYLPPKRAVSELKAALLYPGAPRQK